MIKTFRIAYSLKNTYRVNSIIYGIKQIPVLKSILPEALYRIRGFKIFANVLTVCWEIISAFLGKLIYIAGMVSGIGVLYENGADSQVFLHILFLLTMIGAYMNTFIFNPSNDKFYAISIMKMDARKYTLSNYGYQMLRTVAGFLPFTVIFGRMRQVPLWLCLMLPLFVAAAKLIATQIYLWLYETKGRKINENSMSKVQWLAACLLLAAAYGLPYLGVTVPQGLLTALMLLTIAWGVFAGIRVIRFQDYPGMCKALLADKQNGGLDMKQMVRKATEEQQRKIISPDIGIVSKKEGFEFFNELFVKRHRKVLWNSAKRTTAVCLVLMGAALAGCGLQADFRQVINTGMMELLPIFLFVMYIVNRGIPFTQALFGNCDHSMLTYAFYKKPENVLKLFRIRLLELIKVNLVPAAVIGIGLPLLLYVTGGTDHPVHYVVLPVAIMAMSIFFSVHYLTCYYLLQPFNAYTEVKSGTYKLVSWATYIFCWVFIRIRMNSLVFGGVMTVFCIAYSIAACILVYKLAYKTFKLRN